MSTTTATVTAQATAARHPARARRALIVLACAVGILAVLLAVYFVLIWPWMNGWGASASEMSAPLPGDELVPQAANQATRAITIAAPPEKIWPWLLQNGVDRGGMYSYDWLENLFGLHVHTIPYIDPQFQDLKAGDFVRFTPRDFFMKDGPGYWVQGLDAPHALLACMGMSNKPEGTLVGRPCVSTWQFVLQPLPGGSTRLLLRSRTPTSAPAEKLFNLIDFIMGRKMLLNLRAYAEREQ